MTKNTLFEELQVGELKLKNRIALAPLTRGRAGAKRIPNELMAEYYYQRSEAALLISEATSISPQANGWVNSPGIYTEEMVAGWKKVNERLKGANSHLFLQLWHTGRASHSDFHDGDAPVSASAVKLAGDHIHTPKGQKQYEIPRALTISEIQATVQDYKNAAIAAKEAGLAGVEIHAANGYLINQFLDAKSNQRSDQYGGSFENRFRFLREIVEEIIEVLPAGRIAVRLSPNGVFNDMGGADSRELFDYVIKELNAYNLGFLHVMDGLGFGFHEQGEPYTLKDVRKIYNGAVIGNCGYNPKSAEEAVANKDADMIAFGRPFITNPDLPTRIRKNLKLTPFEDPSLWYGGGEEGYTDFTRADDA